MDLPATLEPVDCVFSQGDAYSNGTDSPDLEPIWGRMLPLNKGFTVVELRRATYSFGRSNQDDVDVCLDNPIIRTHKNFNAFSKVHFKLVREETPTPHTVIEDASSNGTFVNGKKLGRGNRCVLNCNDEIALALPYCRAFVYVENVANECENAPPDLQQRFIVSRLLGKGAMGEVRLAYAKESWIRAAVKIVAKTRLVYPGAAVDVSKEVAREIGILRSVKHPCVVEVYDVFESENKAFIIMELVDGGELFKRIVESDQSRLKEPIAKLLFYQVLLAVKYLHDVGITHRDLKPENILLTSDDDECLVKVTDFGLSKLIDSASMLKTLCGTPNYLAPEILQSAGTSTYTRAVDMWSAGVILFVMLSGYMPFSVDYRDMPLKDQILKCRFTVFKQRWHDVSDEAFDLVKHLLTVDPTLRPTADDALQHVWFQDEEMKLKAAQLMDSRVIGTAPTGNLTRKRPMDDDGENGYNDDQMGETTKKPCHS